MRRAERSASSSAVVTLSPTRVSSSSARRRRAVAARASARADDLLDQPGVLEAAGDVVATSRIDGVGRDDRVRLSQPRVSTPMSSSSRWSPTRTSGRMPAARNARRVDGRQRQAVDRPLTTCPTGATARMAGVSAHGTVTIPARPVRKGRAWR